MAIGTITIGVQAGKRTSTPTRIIPLQFAGDGAYPADGTPGFEASVRAALDFEFVTLLGVISQDCGGYIPVYDRENDKLKVYEQTDVATSPLIETATANLAGTTFNLLVVAQ